MALLKWKNTAHARYLFETLEESTIKYSGNYSEEFFAFISTNTQSEYPDTFIVEKNTEKIYKSIALIFGEKRLRQNIVRMSYIRIYVHEKLLVFHICPSL
ncbi:conserved hypothetical protein [Trichinella spiralis]|uniref:hypothetical protein n=1 Tax=Trichinella spiralis TaxID=6334 RepID=UPI0001EFD907|nr:conserved hypothetical protein [Trichinella spiralis]